MAPRALLLTTAVFLSSAAALTGCSASDPTPAAPETVTVTVTSDPQPAATTIPASAASSAETTPSAGCVIDRPGVRAIVVQGTVDCTTLTDVWTAAVADPAFTVHGNRNTIVVGDWTCRAHETTPLQTGFCQDGSYRNKFKVVRTG